MPGCYWDTRAAKLLLKFKMTLISLLRNHLTHPPRGPVQRTTLPLWREESWVWSRSGKGDGNSQRGLEHKAAQDFTLHYGCNPWGRNTELTCETAMPTSHREAGHGCNKGVVGTLSVINQLWWPDVIKIANVHLQLKLAAEAVGLWVKMCLF